MGPVICPEEERHKRWDRLLPRVLQIHTLTVWVLTSDGGGFRSRVVLSIAIALSIIGLAVVV